jgi:threonine dehydratase
MIPPFDIMRILQGQDPLLIEAAQSLEDAISRITGKKILFTSSGGIRRI